MQHESKMRPKIHYKSGLTRFILQLQSIKLQKRTYTILMKADSQLGLLRLLALLSILAFGNSIKLNLDGKSGSQQLNVFALTERRFLL